MISVPDSPVRQRFVVHMQQGLVEVDTSEGNPSSAPLRYRLTSMPADLTITSINPTPVEPGFVQLTPGQALEIDAMTSAGETRHFRYSAPVGDTASILLVDFARGTIRAVNAPPVDL